MAAHRKLDSALKAPSRSRVLSQCCRNNEASFPIDSDSARNYSPRLILRLWSGEKAALHTVGVGGGDFFDHELGYVRLYHSRPNGSTSLMRSTPRLSLRGRTS